MIFLWECFGVNLRHSIIVTLPSFYMGALKNTLRTITQIVLFPKKNNSLISSEKHS